jgi:hypothetical protein
METTNKKNDTPKKQFDRGKLIIFKDKVIKVQEETTIHYVGFDIFSEIPYRIKKNPQAIELPEAVINLIKCEKMRVQLAVCLSGTRNGIAKCLGVNDRTLFRMYNNHQLHSDDSILINNKIREARTSGLKRLPSPIKNKLIKAK